MKFLCDQCKAKYQIADEKVQGKTLRMKCRKCGHVIEIRATTTEAPATGETMQVATLSEDAVQAALAKQSVPVPAAPKPAAPRPAAGAAPKPGATQAGGPPRPGAGLGAKPAPKPEPAGSALANAFNKQVGSAHITEAKSPSQRPPAHDVSSEEWYVAIDEVPVGPIRLSELRAKYSQGVVTDDSLVWREGYEEWRPLRTLSDLHAVVREEVSGANLPPRGSLLPNAPGAQGRPAGRSTTTSSPSPAKPVGRPAPAPAVSTARSNAGNVIPFVQTRGGGGLAARKLEDEPGDDEATQIANSPFAVPPKPAEAAPISGALAKNKDDPFGFGVLPETPAPAAAAAGPALTPPPPAAAVAGPAPAEESHRKGMSSGVVALIAAACILLGVVVAVFAVKPKVVEKVVEKRVDVPVSVYVPTAATETAAPVVTAVSPEASGTAAKVAAKTGSAPAATTAAPSTTVASKKLGSLDGPEGPSVGTGGGGGGGGGGALEGKAVESVVASKRVGVRKVCFEPWADKGGASVKITLKIGPDGKVQSSDIASTSGEPAIGQCVQRLSRGWTFPASESGGTFNVPFLFGT